MESYATLGIIEVSHQDLETLLVYFTDGTFAIYSAEQLNQMIPKRDSSGGENAEPGQ